MAGRGSDNNVVYTDLRSNNTNDADAVMGSSAGSGGNADTGNGHARNIGNESDHRSRSGTKQEETRDNPMEIDAEKTEGERNLSSESGLASDDSNTSDSEKDAHQRKTAELAVDVASISRGHDAGHHCTLSMSNLAMVESVQQQHQRRNMPKDTGLLKPAINLSKENLPLLANVSMPPPATTTATHIMNTRTKSRNAKAKPFASVSPPLDNRSSSDPLRRIDFCTSAECASGHNETFPKYFYSSRAQGFGIQADNIRKHGQIARASIYLALRLPIR
ncbi:hypothetical protein HK102_012934 [Quaeritorhiza haematococci]|nr:hypothetical protein HK102_012934 [Quaeritorhiza haematococci]